MRRLWSLPGVVLVTPTYAIDEARRNLVRPGQSARLHALTQRLVVVESVMPEPGSLPVCLPDKDAPVLADAILSSATHLLTGDKQHFGPYLRSIVGGLLVITPSAYLVERAA